jgi:Derlin-2/3
MGGSVQDNIMGICVGHIYYFFSDVYPLMPTSGGINVFKTPSLLKRVMGQVD